MSEQELIKNRGRHDFLIQTFFPGVEGPATKMIGDYTLVKGVKRDTGDPRVYIYRNDDYFRRESYVAHQQRLSLGYSH